MLGISFDLPQMSNFSEAFLDVLRACLVFEPSQRISAKALNAMPFFSEKSQDNERWAVFKDHELESIDARFAWLSHRAPIPILSEFPTPKITSRWEFGPNDSDDSSELAPESSFPDISLSSDLHEHRSHLENLYDALETKSVDILPPDSPHLKALSLGPKVPPVPSILASAFPGVLRSESLKIAFAVCVPGRFQRGRSLDFDV